MKKHAMAPDGSNVKLDLSGFNFTLGDLFDEEAILKAVSTYASEVIEGTLRDYPPRMWVTDDGEPYVYLSLGVLAEGDGADDPCWRVPLEVLFRDYIRDSEPEGRRLLLAQLRSICDRLERSL